VAESERSPEPEPEAEAAREAERAAAAAEPAGPEREQFLEDIAEIRDTVDAIDAEVERIPDSETVRRAEVEEAGINEPVMHEPQAEPELESAWQPGTDSGHYEAAADLEPEIEM
jgi:hypothetical protein